MMPSETDDRNTGQRYTEHARPRTTSERTALLMGESENGDKKSRKWLVFWTVGKK